MQLSSFLKYLLTYLLFFVTGVVFGQNVGINTTGATADPSSILDVSATDKGMLVPRVYLNNVSDNIFPVTFPATGLLVYNTNASVSGGNGAGFYYWTGTLWMNLLSAGSAMGDHDWYEVSTTTAPDNISDEMYHLGNTALGKNTASYPLDIDAGNALRGVNILNGSTAAGNKTGIYVTMNSSWDNDQYSGIFNEMNTSGVGLHYAVYNRLLGDGAGQHYGYYSYFGGSGSGTQTGTYAQINNSGNGQHYGAYNYLIGSGSGLHYGVYNHLSGYGTGGQYGVYNQIENYSTGAHIGVLNNMVSDNCNVKYGVNNTLSGNGNDWRFGMYNTIYGNGIGERYGAYTFFSGSGIGRHFGLYTVNANSGSGDHYGAYSDFQGTGTGQQIGTYTTISNSGSGSHIGQYTEISNGTGNNYGLYSVLSAPGAANYGLYVSASGATTNYAGMFIGHIVPGANNAYDLGTTALRWRDVWCQRNAFNGSDYRLKQNIQNLPYGLKEVLNMHPVTFQWKDDTSRRDLGFIAQEVREILPEIILNSKDSMNTLLMNYSGVIPVLVNAIKEQQELIDQLQMHIDQQNMAATAAEIKFDKLVSENQATQAKLALIETLLLQQGMAAGPQPAYLKNGQ